MTAEDWLAVFLPLLFTITVEWVVCFIATSGNALKTAGFVLLTNLITWPVATLMFWHWPSQILWIELLVAVAETVLIAIYWGFNPRKSGSLSLAMNASSYFIGIWVFR